MSDGEDWDMDMMEDDDEYEYEYEDEDELPMSEDTLDFMAVHTLKRRLMEKEKEIRSLLKEGKGEEYQNVGTISGRMLGKVQGEQIFSSVESSKILLNEFISTLEKGKQKGFELVAIDDNLYTWRVVVNKFVPGTELSRTMKEVERKYNFHCVELELRFLMDMYPFYPPVVKIVRPRFDGFMVGRVASMESLQLSHWNPVKGVMDVLLEVLDVMNRTPVDVDSPLNDPVQFPGGSYSELEFLLMRLGHITEVLPRAVLDSKDPERISTNVQASPTSVSAANANGNSKAEDSNTDKAKDRDEDDSKAAKSKVGDFSKGMGYSSHNSQGWDVAAYHAAQKENDRQIIGILQAINQQLSVAESDVADLSHENAALGENGYQILYESALIPVLVKHLRNTPLLEIQRHEELYKQVFDLCQNLASFSHLVSLLVDTHKTESVSLIKVLHSLNHLAEVYVRNEEKAKLKSVAKSDETPGVETTIVSVFSFCHEQTLRYCRYDVTDPTSVRNSFGRKSTDDGAQVQVVEDNQDELAKLHSDYIRTMQPFLFGESELEGFSIQPPGKVGASNRSRIKRIGQELADLSVNLPLQLESSVFVRSDEESMDKLRALITGPMGTPYGFGCFLFDITFPNTYPNEPPLVNLITTGGGTVRFNPNLYNSGKVCLSLLGTWRGAKGEGWDSQTSTLNQVLISIQSLILVADPYFNEPGYQGEIGTSKGAKHSNSYNQNIQVETIRHAMIAHLKKPPKGFEEVVREHFKLCRGLIKEQLAEWKSSYSIFPGKNKVSLATVSKQLVTMLDNLGE